jgi:hypothetical protein
MIILIWQCKVITIYIPVWNWKYSYSCQLRRLVWSLLKGMDGRDVFKMVATLSFQDRHAVKTQTIKRINNLHSQFRASRNRSATDLLKPVVNKPISGCVRSPCTWLFWQVRNGLSTGLLQAVVTELQQCCFQQACRKLLWWRTLKCDEERCSEHSVV